MTKQRTVGATTQKPSKKRSPWLPIMGITLAVLLGAIAYLVAPMLLDLIADQSSGFKKQMDDFQRDPQGLPEKSFEYVAAIVLWLVLMGVMMFIAAATVGPDPERESLQTMGPSPADKKAMVKDLQKRLKEAKKREREMQKRRPKSK